jgi:hypothetical protein
MGLQKLKGYWGGFACVKVWLCSLNTSQLKDKPASYLKRNTLLQKTFLFFLGAICPFPPQQSMYCTSFEN